MLCIRFLTSPIVALVLVTGLDGTALAQRPSGLTGVAMVDLDGHAVRVQAVGLDRRKPGTPVVVFEAGVANSLDIWEGILPQVAALAPAVAYDRAGLGFSEWDETTPTPRHVADRLRRLLRLIEADPPYVLVGYSWGGMLARYFSSYYPETVAGLVLVDPGPMITQSFDENLAPFDAIGAARAGYEAYWSRFAGLFEKAAPPVRAEFDVLRRLMDIDVSDRDLHPVPEVPMIIVVAAKYLALPNLQLPFDPRAHFEADLRYRIRILGEWTLASPRGTLVVSNHTTHAVTREDPDLVVWAVTRVVSMLEHRS
jgi:pimeloyl-ACP methyl ester carboxylesterase